MQLFKVLSVAVALVLSACSTESNEEAIEKVMSEAVGTSLKSLDLVGLNGIDVQWPEVAPKPVIVNVWATWCAPCIRELPSLLDMAEQGNFSLLTISVNANGGVVREFLQEQNLGDLPVVLDPNGVSINEKIGLRGVPVTYIVDKNYVIKGVEMGEREWDHDKMTQKIKSTLAR